MVLAISDYSIPFILVTGYGDVVYNSRRNLLAAIPVTGKMLFHLFNIQYSALKNNYTVSLLAKMKWNEAYPLKCSY